MDSLPAASIERRPLLLAVGIISAPTQPLRRHWLRRVEAPRPTPLRRCCKRRARST